MITTRIDNDLSPLLAALADPTRRRIVEMLAQGPRTATEIYREFAIADPAVSRHLRVLREAGLISDQPVAGDKRVRLYRVDAESLAGLSRWLDGVNRGWQSQLDSFEHYVAMRAGRREEHG